MRLFIKIYFLLIIGELIIFNLCDCLKKEFEDIDIIDNDNNNNNNNNNNSKSINCGEIFTGINEYLIKSPNYPNNYNNNLNCIYKLNFSESSNDCLKSEFEIQFLDFQIEQSYNCSNDFFKLDKNNYYCGNKSFKNIQKFYFDNDYNIINLIFHSNDNDINGKGFMILIKLLKCPEIFRKNSKPELISDQKNYRDKISAKIFQNIPQNIELPIFGAKNFHDLLQSSSSSSPPPSITSYLYIPKRNFEETKKVLNLFFIPPKSENSIPKIEKVFNQENSQRWLTYGVPDSLGQEFDDKKNCHSDNNNNNKENFGPNFDPFHQEFHTEDPSFGVNINDVQSVGIDDWFSLNSECCSGRSYSSKNFLLVSPNFPSLIGSSNNYDCRYTIKKSSENICRLNLNFKYFNFGTDDKFCAYGYIEIDDQRYCGCKTGLNLTTNFDNISTKIISIKNFGYRMGKFSGFVIEVNQESCFNNNDRGFYIDKYYRNNNSELISSIPAINNIRNLLNNNLYCRIFKFLNWVKAAKNVNRMNSKCQINSQYSSKISNLVSVIPIFPDNSNSLIFGNYYPLLNRNCESVNIVEGTISSIYYPNGYPNNLNRCYRFIKAPGYCQIELTMIDFDLEESRSCKKDYILFYGLNKRYCGLSLANSRTIFDLTKSNYAEFYFVTDSSGNGRGFKIGFSQISCSDETPTTSSSNYESKNYY